MKKGILAFIVFSCMTVSVFAQGISLGPVAGITYSTIKGLSDGADPGFKEKYLFGTQFGAAVNIGINEMFSIQPEFTFSQQGGILEAEKPIKGTVKNNFINIPVLAKVAFGKEKGVKVFAVAGPYGGYWLSSRYKQEEDGVVTADEETALTSDKSNRFDYGVAFGAGLGFPVGPGSLNLDLRYNLGFADLDKTDIAKRSNRVLGASLSYLIKLGNN